MAWSNNQGETARGGAPAQLLESLREIPEVVWFASAENRIGKKEQLSEQRNENWGVVHFPKVTDAFPNSIRRLGQEYKGLPRLCNSFGLPSQMGFNKCVSAQQVNSEEKTNVSADSWLPKHNAK